MLKEIERDSLVFIQGDDLAVNERIGWELFTRTGDMRELRCEEVPSPRPEGDSARIPTGETAVPVEFYLVEPFVTLG